MKLSRTLAGILMGIACSFPSMSFRAQAQLSHETYEERNKREEIEREKKREQDDRERMDRIAVRDNLNIIVMLSGELAGADILGAGIVVGGDKERLYVATANHLVRRGSANGQNLRVTFERHAAGSPRLSRPATLLPPFDPQLDLAVLGVSGIGPQEFDVCSELRVLWSRDAKGVLPIGNPNGRSWAVPAIPDAIVNVERPQIVFQSQVLSRGHSGGALLTTSGDLVGMIIDDAPPFGIALHIHDIRQTLHRWQIPEQIRGEAKCNLNQDYVAARQNEKAAAMRDTAAMVRLGVMYDKGDGVAQDVEIAREWNEKAAAGGEARAMNSLGVYYEEERGDFASARQWYEKAAAGGQSAAMYHLGYLYEHAWRGIQKDPALARQWYEKAAAAGHNAAMYNLGLLYEEGKGVARDVAMARQWYEKAAAAGNKSASERLEKLAKQPAADNRER